MKILFSSSEGKREESNNDLEVHLDNLFAPSLTSLRKRVLENMEKRINNADVADLKKIFSTTRDDVALECKVVYGNHRRGIMAAIERYSGVGFEALDYKSLNKAERGFISNNVLIFSNIYGPLLPLDQINDYKFKQGETIGGINIGKEFGMIAKSEIDTWVGDELVLDLRASAYKSFYNKKENIITVDFLINGKVVSHSVKKYRGLLLREVAKNGANEIKKFEEILKNFGSVHLVTNGSWFKYTVGLKN